MSDARRFAPATERNREPIREVLARALPATGCVLEIASGTGEHASHFARHFPELLFQPSDPDAASRASIEARRQHEALPNLAPPLEIDVMRASWWRGLDPVDAILCINMIHIAPWRAAEGLVEGAAALLRADAPLILYGPYRREGQHTADSNAVFDANLRRRDAAWGVRDLEDVEALAASHGFLQDEVVGMPANNLTLVWRGPDDPGD